MTVAELLAASREQHRRKRDQFAGRPDKKGTGIAVRPNIPAQEECIREALRLRLLAHSKDRAHTDPAWAEDERLNRGVTHKALVTHFREFLKLP